MNAVLPIAVALGAAIVMYVAGYTEGRRQERKSRWYRP